MDDKPVKWKLKEVLEIEEITPYFFWQESGMGKGTVYRLVNGKTTTVNTKTLNTVMKTLKSLTKKTFAIEDVLEYVDET